MAEMNESVQRFTTEVDAAVASARRASSDAAERAEGFRAENDKLAKQLRDGAPRGGLSADDEKLRSAAEGFRRANGLPVEEFPEPAAAGPAVPRRRRLERKPGELGYDDEDFSQGTLLS